MRRITFFLLTLVVFPMLVACGQTLTIYDITAAPQNYAGKTITVQGYYVWKPGNPGISVLAKAVSTRDDGTDAQPLDELVWLEGFPAELTEQLHRPVDSVYGAVEVTGNFQTGSFGPEGKYKSQLTITNAKVIEKIEYVETMAPKETQPNHVSVYDLEKDPAKYNGQTITTRGFYFWTQATSGLLTTGVKTEKPADATVLGNNPQPMGTPISMEGFPPDLSSQLNVGPGNGFVWGLIDVSGTFQTGGKFGLEGRHASQLIIDPASVKVVK
ncbi:MAG: hypothetical protein KAX40_06115 [Herpetosiphon sp.]|nr:hypothetical protein [Herpetosiphon sp.]